MDPQFSESSWWFQPTQLKTYASNWIMQPPRFGVNIQKKCVKLPPRFRVDLFMANGILNFVETLQESVKHRDAAISLGASNLSTLPRSHCNRYPVGWIIPGYRRLRPTPPKIHNRKPTVNEAMYLLQRIIGDFPVETV